MSAIGSLGGVSSMYYPMPTQMLLDAEMGDEAEDDEMSVNEAGASTSTDVESADDEDEGESSFELGNLLDARA